jgi:hypothetical protein
VSSPFVLWTIPAGITVLVHELTDDRTGWAKSAVAAAALTLLLMVAGFFGAVGLGVPIGG